MQKDVKILQPRRESLTVSLVGPSGRNHCGFTLTCRVTFNREDAVSDYDIGIGSERIHSSNFRESIPTLINLLERAYAWLDATENLKNEIRG